MCMRGGAAGEGRGGGVPSHHLLSPPSADTATHAQGHGLFRSVAFLKTVQISSGSFPELPPPLQNPSGPLHPLFLEAVSHQFPMRSPLFKAF